MFSFLFYWTLWWIYKCRHRIYNNVVLEDIHYNFRLLNFEPTKHRIEYVANNSFMKLSQETHIFNNASFRVNHLERVPS